MLKLNGKRTYITYVLIFSLFLSSLGSFFVNPSFSKSLSAICPAHSLMAMSMDTEGGDKPLPSSVKKSCPYCFISHYSEFVPHIQDILRPDLAQISLKLFSYEDVYLSSLIASRYEARAPPYAA